MVIQSVRSRWATTSAHATRPTGINAEKSGRAAVLGIDATPLPGLDDRAGGFAQPLSD